MCRTAVENFSFISLVPYARSRSCVEMVSGRHVGFALTLALIAWCTSARKSANLKSSQRSSANGSLKLSSGRQSAHFNIHNVSCTLSWYKVTWIVSTNIRWSCAGSWSASSDEATTINGNFCPGASFNAAISVSSAVIVLSSLFPSGVLQNAWERVD